MKSIVEKVLSERPENPYKTKEIKMREILDIPTNLGGLELPEELTAMMPQAFYINEEGNRTREKKKIEKKTSQFFWESKITIILLIIMGISAFFLIILTDWLI